MATAHIQNFPGISVEGAVVAEVPRTGRKQRRPSHPFYLQYSAYDIQPFLLAPVLPGETMKNALLQAKCTTDPLASPLIGWWNEYYIFYVKLSDMVDVFDELSEMLLKNTAPSFLNTAAVATQFYNGSGINFTQQCLKRVVETYFRDEEEVANGAIALGAAATGGGGYKAKVLRNNALQSLVLDSDTPAAEVEELPGQVYPSDLPAHLSAFEEQYDQWKELVAMRMTEATFEDWLRSFGVRAPREERENLHIPELIRYVREFGYPANHAVGGTAAPIMSWSIAERADKDRFFAEPGFIFGVTCCRPKVYLSKQTGAVAHQLSNAFAWLPAVLQEQPYTSLRKFDETTGPVRDLASDYWLDIRDLFMYGEQFVHFGAGANVVTLPDDSAVSGQPLNADYAANTDIAPLFANTTNIRCDGRVDLSILSRVTDTTP